MSYTATTIPGLDETTPAENDCPLSDVNNAIREVKTVLQDQYTVVSIDDGDSPYTATTTSSVILADATANVITINLPTAASIAGRIYTIKKIDSSTNIITIDGYASETIDDDSTYILNSYNDEVTLCSNGTHWYIINECIRPRLLDVGNENGYEILQKDCDGFTTILFDQRSYAILYLPEAYAGLRLTLANKDLSCQTRIVAQDGDAIRWGADTGELWFTGGLGCAVDIIAINDSEWVCLTQPQYSWGIV